MEVSFDDNHIFEEFQFKVAWCGMCGHHIVCPKCRNNCCNGCYGIVNGKECDICPLAYQYQDDMFAMMHRHSGLSKDDYEAIYREMVADKRKKEEDVENTKT